MEKFEAEKNHVPKSPAQKRLDSLIKALGRLESDEPGEEFDQNKIAQLVKKFEEDKEGKPSTFSKYTISNIKNEQTETKVMEVIKRVEAAFSDKIVYDENSKTDKKYTYLVPTLREKDFAIEVLPEKMAPSTFFTAAWARGKRKIKIIDTWIHYFDEIGDHNLNALLKDRDSIKILALHPFSDALHLRAESLGRSIGQVQDELLDNLKAVLAKAAELKMENLVEIRLYEDLPSVNAFILDNEVYFGHFLSSVYSTDAYFFYFKFKACVYHS